MAENVPPGRAGRLWLRGRLAAARRAMELLDRKRQLLLRERARVEQVLEASEASWVSSCREAETWSLRTSILGGSTEVAAVATSTSGRATVEVRWQNTMGVRHPDEPRLSSPELAPEQAAASNSAVLPSAVSHRRALEAAVHHAVTRSSYEMLRAELASTQRRHRAIERRRVPMLEETLRGLELRLDELEREQRVVTRWAQQRMQGKLGGPATGFADDQTAKGEP